MPELYIDHDEGEYVSGDYTITVRRESYQGFRMFQKIRYEEKSKIPFSYFCIINRKKRNIIMYDYDSRNNSRRELVEYVEVFVRNTNPHTPLVIKVCIYGVYKYYKCSETKYNKKFLINNLPMSSSVNGKLSEHLINENDILNKKITFRIEKKSHYNHINVEKVENKEDYIVYKHTPTNGYTSYKSCVFYKNILFKILSDNKKENSTISTVQGINIQHINSYYQKNHDDKDVPLLVEFVKSDGSKHYFSRKNNNQSYWTEDQIKKSDESFKDKISEIEFSLDHSIIVLINMKNKYPCIPCKKIASTFPIHHKKSEESLENNFIIPFELAKNANQNYSCYQHILTNYNSDKHFVIKRLFISTKEIQLYDRHNVEDYLFYNNKKNYVYVYFYKGDNLPLVVKFDGKWYGPKTKKTYFTSWIEIDLKNKNKSNHIFSDLIEKELDKINMMLNEVNIYKISDYGLEDLFDPEIQDEHTDHICDNERCEKECLKKIDTSIRNIFDTTRISVKSIDYKFFKVFIHRTKNNFKIGNIVYDFKNFKLNKSEMKHINIELNTVSVFYFNYNLDTYASNPLLLALKSDLSKIEYFKIRADKDINPKNYHLDTISNFKIENNGLYNLLQHQNYLLNKVICVNLDKKSDYRCCESNDSYLHHKIIVKKVEIGEGSTLEKNNYNTYRHLLEEPGGSPEENMILLEKITYYDKFKTKVKINHFKIGNHVVKFKSFYKHIENPLFTIKVAYVHFYDKDPRPLLVYCNNVALAPKRLEDYYKKWQEVDSINYSRRGDGNHDLLSVKYKLDEICYYINPVDISKLVTYIIDEKSNNSYCDISVAVSVDKDSIPDYVIITHKSSEGFRLGLIKYKEYYLFESYKHCTYKTSELKKVIAYFYKYDLEFEYPLLIELDFENKESNQYYILVSTSPHEWKKTPYRTLEKDSIMLGLFLWNINYKFNMDKIMRYDPENLENKSEFPGYDQLNYMEQNYADIGFEEYGGYDLTDPHNLLQNDEGYNFEAPFYDVSIPERIEITPKMVDIPIMAYTSETTSESDNSKLAGILGGVFCSLGAVGGSGFLVYKYFLKGMVFDMRPFF